MVRSFDTLLEALNTLQSEGYTYDFNLLADDLYCKALEQSFIKKDWHVDEIFRFEGESNPADSSILYAISTNTGIKGTLLNAYGVYADSMSAELIKKLTG